MYRTLLSICLLLTLLACSQESGLRAVKVADGDTTTLLNEQNEQQKIRLHGIDAPEKGQPYSREAKAYLGSLLQGGNLRIEIETRDRYGRTVATVYNSRGQNVNLEMVKAGYAWHYVKYSQDKALFLAEQEARMKRRGLWAGANAEAPWQYRKRMRQH